jgi:hypothetical protein
MLALPAVHHFAIGLLAPVSGKNGRVERVELDLERCLDHGRFESRDDSLSFNTSGRRYCH